MRHKNIPVILILIILSGLSCRDKGTELLPPQHVSTLTLVAEDVGVTDVMLKISIAKGSYPRTITLKRDTTTLLTTILTSTDTILIDEGLLPKHTYKYTLSRPLDGRREEIKNITVTTMDTTSHNFTWEIDTLGDGNSSVLRDVVIINDTLAYAVGEIYKRDSVTGQFETTPYNAARWDGYKWQLLRIKIRLDYGTDVIYTYTRLNSVFAFGPDDIWFVHYVGGVTRYKDGKWTMMEFPLIEGPGGANKIWGLSSNDIYFVADLGRITHYNGTWNQIESGTDLDIYDIFGNRNERTGEIEIYAVAAKLFVTFDKKIFKIDGTKVIEISAEGIPYDLHGVWFKPGTQYYVVGSGIYHKRNPMNSGMWEGIPASVTQYGIYRIMGNNINDIVVCGSFGELLHYNGMSWKSYMNVTAISLGAYYGLSFKDNLIMAVGQESPKGIIAIGRQ